jgi:hypothetical protein
MLGTLDSRALILRGKKTLLFYMLQGSLQKIDLQALA